MPQAIKETTQNGIINPVESCVPIQVLYWPQLCFCGKPHESSLHLFGVAHHNMPSCNLKDVWEDKRQIILSLTQGIYSI